MQFKEKKMMMVMKKGLKKCWKWYGLERLSVVYVVSWDWKLEKEKLERKTGKREKNIKTRKKNGESVKIAEEREMEGNKKKEKLNER